MIGLDANESETHVDIHCQAIHQTLDNKPLIPEMD